MINELPVDVSVIEHGVEYPLDAAIGQQKLADNTALIEQYHQSNGGRITCRYGPQAADMCSVELLREDVYKRQVLWMCGYAWNGSDGLGMYPGGRAAGVGRIFYLQRDAAGKIFVGGIQKPGAARPAPRVPGEKLLVYILL